MTLVRVNTAAAISEAERGQCRPLTCVVADEDILKTTRLFIPHADGRMSR
jgi:hypothetical protein